MRALALVLVVGALGCTNPDTADKAQAQGTDHFQRNRLSSNPAERRVDDPAPTHLPSYVPPAGTVPPGTPVRTVNTHDPMVPSPGPNNNGAARGVAPAGYLGPRPGDAERMLHPGEPMPGAQGKLPASSTDSAYDTSGAGQAAPTPGSDDRAPQGDSDPDHGTTGDYGGPARGVPTK